VRDNAALTGMMQEFKGLGQLGVLMVANLAMRMVIKWDSSMKHYLNYLVTEPELNLSSSRKTQSGFRFRCH
jgi:hypothetical protein